MEIFIQEVIWIHNTSLIRVFNLKAEFSLQYYVESPIKKVKNGKTTKTTRWNFGRDLIIMLQNFLREIQWVTASLIYTLFSDKCGY